MICRLQFLRGAGKELDCNSWLLCVYFLGFIHILSTKRIYIIICVFSFCRIEKLKLTGFGFRVRINGKKDCFHRKYHNISVINPVVITCVANYCRGTPVSLLCGTKILLSHKNGFTLVFLWGK